MLKQSLFTRNSLLALLALSLPAFSQVNILSNRYDNARTGSNLAETTLATQNVNVNQFGRLYTYPVDGAMYAQPLYVAGLAIAGAAHNVVYAATMNDKLYAFDADSAGAPLWSRDFTDPTNGITAIPITDLVGSNTLNIVGNVGIESTPVIDLSTNTMYLVVRTKENGAYLQRLHALDITTGADKTGSPVVISGSVNGSATDAINGTLTFDPKLQNQRAGLVLTNGVVVIAWGSHEDDTPYHGWVMGYDASALTQVGIFCTTPNGAEGGIWQSGRAPLIDASGNVYFMSGNGDWDGATNFGDSIVKLGVSKQGLSVLDWFTPSNQSTLNTGDIDFGSSGPMLIPGTDVVIAGGKDGNMYLLHSGNLGQEVSGNTQVIQTVQVNGGMLKNGPAFWNAPEGPLVYTWAQSDFLKAYHFNGTNLDSSVFATGTIASPGSPGGALTVTANGSTAGTGIVWAALTTSGSANHGNQPGVLRAFNAENLQELWDSEQSPTRDRLGTLVKFVPPVVVNGKVYAVTYDNVLAVYGLLGGTGNNTPDFTLSAGNLTATAGATANGAVNVGVLNGFSGTVAFTVSGLPSAATASFNPQTVTGAGSTTLQITTGTATPPGTYTLTITGTSGTLSHTASAQLNVTSTPAAPAISIDFVGLGTVMGASEVAGVLPKANWNNATGASSTTPLALVDENGNASAATVSWKADNVWQTKITDAPGNARMMKGYLDALSHSTTVTVSGLAPSASGYNVFVYVDGDNTGTRTGAYQISGSGITTTSILATDAAGTNFSGSFIQANNTAGNYVEFTIQSTAFTITATPGATSDGYARAPLNAIQIVPASGPDFSLAASGISAVAGGPGNGTVNVSAVNGFAGSVSFSISGLPNGATATFNPTTVTGAGSTTLQIATAATTPAGTYPLAVTGTSGSTSHTAAAQLVVTGNSQQSATAISVDFVGLATSMASTEVAGVVGKANWNNASGAASTAPLALVDENGNATNTTVTWRADGTWQTKVTDAPGNARMMKGYLDSRGGATTVTVAGLAPSSAGYNVYVYFDGDNTGARTGSYQISGPGIATATVLGTDAAATNFSGSFVQANNSPGNYIEFAIQATGFTVSVKPSSTTDGYLRAPLNGIQIVPASGSAPDFSLTASNISAVAGSTGNGTVNVSAVNGFTGSVSFSVSGLPTGATATFNPATVTGAGSTALQIATATTTAAGTYPLTITGTSSTSHTAVAQLFVTSNSPPAVTAISVDFVGLATPMTSTEVAGVVGKANWNNATGAASTAPLALVDENGNASNATVTWRADGTWQTKITDAPGNARMMKGYLDSRGGATTVTVTGLPVNAKGYSVYLYTDGDNTGARTGSYQISGAGITTTAILATDAAATNFSGAFIQANNSAGNYVVFTIQATSFTLSAKPSSTTDGYLRAAVNGIQVVPLP